jgi:ParB family chromosome partitioning protein
LVTALDEYPIKKITQEELEQLRRVTENNGIQIPLVVRRQEDGNGYDLIDGYRRICGAEMHNIDYIPCIIKNISRDEAVLMMLDGILEQRQELLISERARIYHARVEAIKRQGARTDLTLSLQGIKLIPDIAEEMGISETMLKRVKSLVDLIPPLLDQVDVKSLHIETGEYLSRMPEEHQQWVYECMEENFVVPTVVQAAQIRKLSKEGNLTENAVFDILTTSIHEMENVTLKGNWLKSYFSKDATPKEITETIEKALKLYFAFLEKQNANHSHTGKSKPESQVR